MNPTRLFRQYLQALTQVTQAGDAREESYYQALADLLRGVAEATGRSDAHVTILPKGTEAGNPDFRVWNGRDGIVGYIEGKAPIETDLDRVEATEQLQRYRGTFANLILTNLLEFRLYRNGACIQAVTVGRPFVPNQLRTAPPLERGEELWRLLDTFLGFSLPQTYTAESLAVELARRTRYLRDMVAEQLAEEQGGAAGDLSGFYEAFQTYLIASLAPADFADLYAQTITYGLFAARTRAENGFSRRSAFHSIPHTIGILRDVFRFISLGDLPASLEWIVDDIAAVLAAADAPGILARYYREGKGSDPVVHFYETFLAAYDPQERERRGVYYTPEPVVSYIVRSLHRLLQDEFGLADGLAAEEVTLLDPAAGTMTFVAHAAQQAVDEFARRYGQGARGQFIRERILRNYYAFELMMAPYAVGHLKMAFLLEELGHRLADDERVSFYLTNTLEMEELEESRLPGFASLAEESRLAGAVKRQTPILVILGNPPYSGISANMGEWITGLIEDYKYVEGEHFGERKHWLQDDYVKFLRFAEWKIAQAGCGVVGMITNHGYLDNPTFRGMRWHLLQTYDEIRVLDLHGNALKRETCPDGSPDENVFDIRQGVAIAFFIKRGGGEGPATVHHAELWGTREGKYAWLQEHDVSDTDWRSLQPAGRFYFYVPRDGTGAEQYEAMVPVTEVFPMHVTRIVTARDRFVIDHDREALLRRIHQFRDLSLPDELLRQAYGLKDTRGWKIPEKRRRIAALEDWRAVATRCLYRPFDVRWIYYHPDMVDWGRWDMMRHMLVEDNVAMCIGRAGHVAGRQEWNLVFCSHCAVDFNAFYRGGNLTMPLWLHPDGGRNDLFAELEGTERRPNLSPALLEALAAAHGREPAPELVFYYVYAVLYSETYRETYAEFLRVDFPRIPFTGDAALFRELAVLGERLVGLHLLRSPALDPPLARFEGQGDNCVERRYPRYSAQAQRVDINAGQWFAPVPEAVWAYQVGGYQVCAKWLKDRRERRLTLEEIRTYCRIVTALQRTIAVQAEIDALYPRVEESVVEVTL